MSLKSIELQVAIPRTVEAGKISEQLQQRGQNAIDQAAAEMETKSQQKRQTITKTEEKDGIRLKDQDRNNNHQRQKENQNAKDQAKPMKKTHPYKGKTIDYNG